MRGVPDRLLLKGMAMEEKTLKRITVLSALVSLAGMIPVLLSLPFTRMTLDDFVYAADTHIIWVEQHSVAKMLARAFERLFEVYMKWNGSLAANFFCAFHAGSFGEKYYWINLLIHFFIFSAAIWKMSETIFMNLLKSDRLSAVLCFALVLFVSVQFVPDSTDAFFAYNLASMYTGYYSFMILTTAYLLDFTVKEKPKVLTVLIACITAFMSVEGHLSVGIMFLSILICYWVVIFFTKHRISKPAILISLIAVAGFLINVLAPGYRNRASDIDYGMSAISSVLFSFVHGLEKINSFTCIYTFMAFVIIAWLVLRSFAKRDDTPEGIYRWPLIALFGLFGIYASLFTANYYALGATTYPRLDDVAYFAFFWMVIFAMVILIGWLNFHWDKELKKFFRMLGSWFENNPWKTIAAFGLLLVMSVLSSGNLDSILGINLTRRLLNGDLKQFASERDQWTAACEANKGKDVVVDELTVYVDAIDKWHAGLDPEEYNWVNGNIANYYQVKTFTVNYH